MRDIASILLVQADAIDRAYVAEWAGKLGVTAEWQMILNRLHQVAD